MNTQSIRILRLFRLAQLPLLALLAVAFVAMPQVGHATANYVYHERTGNDPGCGGQYVTTLTPNSAQSHPLRWKIEYQTYTTQTRVYYTTDGSAPAGAFGVASGTTTVLTGSYLCTFGGPVVDVAGATIPAQPAGTVVKYIISAWHSGGGAEIFANSGEFSSPFTTSAAATLFTYTVSSTPQATALVESKTSAGALTANPPYLESGIWTDSGSKSTASGGLVGVGSRFATNGTPNFKVTPTLTVGVTYAVQSTLTASTASPDLVAAIATTGTSASTLPATTTAFQTGKGNLWTTLGTITPSSTTPSVTFTYSSGILHTTNRFYADAVRFIPVTASGTKTWNGGGTTNFWTTGLNWGGTSPNAAGGDAIAFAGSTRTNPVMDGPFSVNAVSFNSGAAGFFVSGVGGSLVVGTAGITNSSASDQLISAPIAQGATALNVTSGASTNQVTVNGLLTGSGGYTMAGAGTLYVSNAANSITGPVSVSGGATLRLPAASSIGGTGVGAGNVTLNGGTLLNDDVSAAGSLLTQNRSIIIGASGGTIKVSTGGQILISSNIITGVGNTMTFTSGGTGNGEIRVQTNGANITGGHFTFSKLVIDAGLYTIGQGTVGGAEDSLGAVPGITTDDAITLVNGGKLRANVTPLTLDVKRGITLGNGGGVLRSINTAAILTVPSAVKGLGKSLTIGGGTDNGQVILSNTGNTFSNVTITGGSGMKLSPGASGVIPDTSLVTLGASGVQFDLNGFDETIRSIAGTAGTFAMGAKTLTVDNPAGESFSSVLTSSSSGKFVKNGSGTLLLSGGSSGFFGEFIINNGTIGIGGSQSLGGGAGSVVTFNGGKLSNTGTGTRSIPGTTSLNINGDFTIDDSLFGPNPGPIVFIGPATIKNSTRTATVSGAATLTLGGIVFDDGTPRGLTKAGNSALTLTATNAYGGDTTILAGTIHIDGDATLGNGAGTIQLSGGTLNTTASRTASTDPVANPINVVSNSAITTSSTAATVDLNLTGTLAGTGGTLVFSNASATAGGDFRPRLAGGTFTMARPIVIANQPNGTTLLSDFNTTSTTHTFNGVISGAGTYRRTASTSGTGGDTVFTAANTFTGGASLNDGSIGLGIDSAGTPPTLTSGPLGTGPLTIGGTQGKLSASGGARTVGNAITFTSSLLTINGANSLTLSGAEDLGASVRTLQVDNSGATEISGVIANTAGGLTKTGPGLLVLSGANTYTGTTIVSNGTLRVNGSLAAGNAVTVVGTLGGTGTVGGVVTVAAAGVITPGASIGTLTLGSAPGLGGTILAEIDRNGGSPLADKINCTGGATLGGALIVTNIGLPPQSGDTFDLFDGAVSGTFSSISLPPGGLLHWKTNNLTVNGTITFTNNNPVAANFSVSVPVGGSTLATVIGKYAQTNDADGDVVTITAVSTPGSGTATIIGGTNITYTSTGGPGSDSFTYTVSDGVGGTDTKTVSVTISSPEGFNKLSGPTGTGPYSFSYLGIPGQNYALDESPNLVAPYTWFPVLTNTAASNGVLDYLGVPLSYPSGSFRTRHVP